MRDDTSGHLRPGRFYINARWALGSKRKKLFFVFLIGKDRRLEHLSPDGEKRHNTPLGKVIIYTGILVWVLLGGFALTAGSLYIAKTWMGINLIKNGSPIPYVLEKIRLCHPTHLTEKK